MFTQMNCKMSRVGPIVDDDVEESFIDCLLVMREWMDGWMDGWREGGRERWKEEGRDLAL